MQTCSKGLSHSTANGGVCVVVLKRGMAIAFASVHADREEI